MGARTEVDIRFVLETLYPFFDIIPHAELAMHGNGDGNLPINQALIQMDGRAEWVIEHITNCWAKKCEIFDESGSSDVVQAMKIHVRQIIQRVLKAKAANFHWDTRAPINDLVRTAWSEIEKATQADLTQAKALLVESRRLNGLKQLRKIS